MIIISLIFISHKLFKKATKRVSINIMVKIHKTIKKIVTCIHNVNQKIIQPSPTLRNPS